MLLFPIGPPGIGKTSSIARFALKWVDGAKELRTFDFVFAIQLKYAHKASSLAELIKLQHDRLKASECFTFVTDKYVVRRKVIISKVSIILEVQGGGRPIPPLG